MPGVHHPTHNLIWASETVLAQPESQWWMLASDGTWQHLIYLPGERRVLEHGKTRLATPSSEPIFSTLVEVGFFDLDTHYPPPDVPVEANIVVVAARLGGQSYRVVAHPPDFWPRGLEEILRQLRQAGAGVTDASPALGYWRADQMDRERAGRVRRRGMLIHRSLQTTMPVLPSSLLRALADPGVWAAIDSTEIDQARELAGDRAEFVIEGPTASWLTELWRGSL